MKSVIQPSLFVIAVVLNSVSVLAVQNDPPEQVLELPECDIYLFDVVEEKKFNFDCQRPECDSTRWLR